MAIEVRGISLGTQVAAADLSAKQYRFVKLDSAGKWALASAQGEFCQGVLQNKPKAGEPADVLLISGGGVTKIVAGAAISAGGVVTTQADGDGDPATSGDEVLGVALEAASGAGEIISVALGYQGKVA